MHVAFCKCAVFGLACNIANSHSKLASHTGGIGNNYY